MFSRNLLGELGNLLEEVIVVTDVSCIRLPIPDVIEFRMLVREPLQMGSATR